MPCFNEGEAEVRAEEDRKYDKWASHNSIPADLLCLVLKNAEEAGLYHTLLGALPGPFHRAKVEQWWIAHQLRDSEKERDEQK